MAKKFYIPIESANQYLSKQVKKWYIPVLSGGSSVSKKVKKAYCAVQVGGQWVSKCFYEDGGGASYHTGFWIFFSTVIEKIIQGKKYTVAPSQVQVDVNKTGSGITFFFFIQMTSSGYIYDNAVITVSTDSNATPYEAVSQGQTDSYTNQDSVVVNNDTWYYTVGAPIEYLDPPQYPSDIDPNCVLMDSSISELSDMEDVVRAFLNNYIYTSDYAESYQQYVEYDLNKTSIELLCRKYFAIFHFKNVSKKSNVNYSTLLQNLDDVIQHIVDFASNNNCNCVRLDGSLATDSYLMFRVRCANLSSCPFRISYEDTANGFSWYSGRELLGETTLYQYQVSITDGAITYRNNGTTQDRFPHAIGVITDINSGWLTVNMSNTGVDLHN